MYDRPQVYGLPPIGVYSGEEAGAAKAEEKPLLLVQLAVLKRPAVWVLGLSSAACYVTRYAFEMWGVLFLTEAKGYSLMGASAVISISQFAGIAGAITCGLISDKFFNHKRSGPCLILASFLCWRPPLSFIRRRNTSGWITSAWPFLAIRSMPGGLPGRVDGRGYMSRKATGAVMGVIGLFSYAGASIQEFVSGMLINSTKTVVNGKAVYNFAQAGDFWVLASVGACLLPLLVWNAKAEEGPPGGSGRAGG